MNFSTIGYLTLLLTVGGHFSSWGQADLGTKKIFGKREEGRSQAWADYYLLARDGTECKVKRYEYDRVMLGDLFSCGKSWERPSNRNLARLYYEY